MVNMRGGIGLSSGKQYRMIYVELLIQRWLENDFEPIPDFTPTLLLPHVAHLGSFEKFVVASFSCSAFRSAISHLTSTKLLISH